MAESWLNGLVPKGGAGTGDWAVRVIDAAPDAIITIDASGRIVRLNPAAERMFGYLQEHAAGRPLVALIIPPPLHAARWAGLMGLAGPDAPRVLDRGVETLGRHRSGREFPVEITVTQLSADPLLLTGFVRDLSPMRLAEQRGAQLERLLASAEELVQMGVYELNLSSRRVFWSDSMYRIYGLEPGKIEPSIELALGQIQGSDKQEVEVLLSTVINRPEEIPGEGLKFEYRLLRADGLLRHIRAYGRVELDEDGRPARWVGSGQDISDQRLTERELLAHRALGRALRDWQSFDAGAEGLLSRLGEALDFPIGTLWVWHEQHGRMEPRASWFASGVDARGLDCRGGARAARIGESVAAQAWRSGRPVIVADVATDRRWGDREAAAKAGLRSALAFPATSDERPLAVLTFYGFESRLLNEQLLGTLTDIGAELGRFLARRRGDLGARPLSAREIDILRLAAEGNSGPGIAAQLTISPATVKTHFENIYEKLGVSDRAAAVAHALRVGLIS